MKTKRISLKEFENIVKKIIKEENECGCVESTHTTKRFAVMLNSDQGKVRIKTSASDEESAKEKVLAHQNAPESAIIDVKEI